MSSEPETAEPRPKSRRSIPRRLKTAFIVIAVLFLCVWFLSPAGTIEAPVRLERDADGALREVSEPQTSALHFGAQATTLRANNQTLTGSSSSHPNPAWFRCESILVMNHSDHLLMKRIGEALVEQLKKDGLLNRIDYLPVGHRPEHGRLAPDIVVRLQLESIDESGLIGRDLKAIVRAEICTTYAAGRRGRSGPSNPPLVQVNANCQVEHESSLLGVESAGSRYAVQGKDIASQIGNAITGKLEEFRGKHAPLPELPGAFYPPFREPPEFEFLTTAGATELVSFHGLMQHNETFWEIEAAADSKTTIELIQSELSDAGWTGRSNESEIEDGFLWMERGGQFVHVFRQTANQWPSQEVGEQPLHVRFVDRMSEDELGVVFTGLINDESPDVELLLRLRQMAGQTQRTRILELVEEAPPRSASAWLGLVELYAARGDQESIFTALNRAHALLETWSHLHGTSSLKSEIERLAKEHDIDIEEVQDLDLSTYEELGFVRLDADNMQGTAIACGDSPAGFIVDNDDRTRSNIVSVYVRPLNGSRARLTIVRSSLHGGQGATSQEIDLAQGWEYHEGTGNYAGRIRGEQNADGVILVSLELTRLPDPE